MNKHSLNFKLNVSILTCVCAGLFAFVYFVTEHVTPIMISQIDALASRAVTEYAKDISHLAADTEQIVYSTKNTLIQTNEKDTDSIHMLLNSAIKTTTHSDLSFMQAWIYTFNADDVSKGTLYLSKNTPDGKTEFRQINIKNLYDVFPWFKEVPKEEKIYWSEPYVDDETGNTVVTCLIPFMFEGKDEFDGLFALTVDISSLQKNIYNYSFYEVGRLLLISRSGLYVTHPNKNISLKMTIFELGDQLNLPQLNASGKDVLAGKIGNTKIPYSSVHNGSAIFFYAPVKHFNWGLFLVYSQKELVKPLVHLQYIMFLALSIIVLFLIFVINRICQKSTRQLIELSKLATRYGQGDFKDAFNEQPSCSDIKMLSTAMENMRLNLLQYTEKEIKEAAEKQKNKSELEIASNIQKASLSLKYPENNRFDISTKMVPAKEVGGDFYDFFFIDENKFAIVIADVSGKGIPAALYMMKAQTLIKNICKGKLPLNEVFAHVNNQLYEGNDTCMFVTAFMAVIDLNTGDVEYVNAGHIPPMVGDYSGYNYINVKKNVILGIRKNAVFEVEKLKLKSGDHIFLYTDGVTEAENAKSNFYGAKRLKKVLEKPAVHSEANLAAVMKDIRKFVKGNRQSDDITMLDFAYFGDTRLILNADNKNLSQMINFLRQDTEKHNISSKKQFNLITAAEEIFANICDYAYVGPNKGKAEIRTYINKGLYYVEFSDKGRRYNPLKVKEPDLGADLSKRKIGGLGIYLAKRMSDRILYAYKGNRNILTIGIKIE